MRNIFLKWNEEIVAANWPKVGRTMRDVVPQYNLQEDHFAGCDIWMLRNARPNMKMINTRSSPPWRGVIRSLFIVATLRGNTWEIRIGNRECYSKIRQRITSQIGRDFISMYFHSWIYWTDGKQTSNASQVPQPREVVLQYVEFWFRGTGAFASSSYSGQLNLRWNGDCANNQGNIVLLFLF